MNIMNAQLAKLFPKLSVCMPALEILLVERQSQDAFLMTRTLNQIGHVFWEQDVEGALELASEREFDIVLLDLDVENAYTLDAFYHFHNKRPEIPVVIISRAESYLLAESALDEGAYNILNKHRLHEGDYLIKMVTGALIKAKFLKKAEVFYHKDNQGDDIL